jgi:hypothetical protein
MWEVIRLTLLIASLFTSGEGHMAREFRSMLAFISSLVLGAFSALSYAVDDALRFVDEAVNFDWHADAHTSIALDSVMRDAGRSPSTALQRAKAFLQRALNHPWWITDHFDPGRHVASTA